MYRQISSRLPACPSALTTAAVCLFLAGNAFAANRNDIYFRSNFETGAVQNPHDSVDGWGLTVISPDHAKVMTEESRENSYGIRLFIDKSRNYSSVNSSGADKPRVNLGKWSDRFSYNKDYWVGLSIFIPEDWVDDYPENHETLVQIKQPVSGPPILTIRLKGSEWEILNRRDDRSDTFASTTTVSELFRASTASDKGKWTDFVMHFRLCPNDGCDGRLEIWKDGEKIVNRSGPNAYLLDPEGKGPHLALNLYKGGWKKKPSRVNTRELYFDAIRFGGSSSDYQSVAPTNEEEPPPPEPEPTRPLPPTLVENK